MREKYTVSDLIGKTSQQEFLEDHPLLLHGIKLIPAPSHSIDDRDVFLPGCTHHILATGNVLHHRVLWREPTLPGLNFDDDQFPRSDQRLFAFQGGIVYGYDFVFDNATVQYWESNALVAVWNDVQVEK